MEDNAQQKDGSAQSSKETTERIQALAEISKVALDALSTPPPMTNIKTRKFPKSLNMQDSPSAH